MLEEEEARLADLRAKAERKSNKPFDKSVASDRNGSDNVTDDSNDSDDDDDDDDKVINIIIISLVALGLVVD